MTNKGCKIAIILPAKTTTKEECERGSICLKNQQMTNEGCEVAINLPEKTTAAKGKIKDVKLL